LLLASLIVATANAALTPRKAVDATGVALSTAAGFIPPLPLPLLLLPELELELEAATSPALLFTALLAITPPFALCRKGVGFFPPCPSAAPCAAMALHCSSVRMPSSLACFVQASRLAVGVEPDHSTRRISAKLRSS
jgi:hypothetical protein